PRGPLPPLPLPAGFGFRSGAICRGPALLIAQRSVGAAPEQERRELAATLHAGQHQRRVEEAVGRVRVGAVVEQEADRLRVAAADRVEERRSPLRVAAVDLRPPPAQPERDLLAALPGRPRERRPAARVRFVAARTLRREEARQLEAPGV